MNAVADRVVRIMSEQSGCAVSDVTIDSKLVEDLGMDSLDIIETVMAVEEEFEMTITDEQAEKISTVSDVISLLEKVKS